MPRLVWLAALLMVSGCGLSYQLNWPTIVLDDEPLSKPEGGTPQELAANLQRDLIAEECVYTLGEVPTDDPRCAAVLRSEAQDVLAIPSLEFFGSASARLYLAEDDAIEAFEVTPTVLGQFDGIWDFYAEELGTEPRYAEWTDRDADNSTAPCVFVDQYGERHLVTEAIRRITWEDEYTRLDVIEHACHGLTRLRFTDLPAKP